MTGQRVSGVLLDGETLVLARALVRAGIEQLRDRNAVANLTPAVAELERLLSRAVAELRSDSEVPMSPSCPQGHGDIGLRPGSSESVSGSAGPRRVALAGRSPGSSELTTSEAAALLRISPRQVRRLRVELGGTYRGKDLMFERGDVEAYRRNTRNDERQSR